MSDDHSTLPAAPTEAPRRQRPKPGERRNQILQALAEMLQAPQADRITTAALAARLQVSEAALYRHFAGKAQMYEALIDFIEHSLFTLANQVIERETDPAVQFTRVVALVLQFGERNPGMSRVLAGDALVHEDARLHQRVNQCLDRLESLLRQPARALAEQRGDPAPTVAAQARSALALSVILGRLNRYGRTAFQRLPTEHLDACLASLLA